MIRRPPRSTQSRSSAASDVYKRQSPDDGKLSSDRLGRVSSPAVLVVVVFDKTDVLVIGDFRGSESSRGISARFQPRQSLYFFQTHVAFGFIGGCGSGFPVVDCNFCFLFFVLWRTVDRTRLFHPSADARAPLRPSLDDAAIHSPFNAGHRPDMFPGRAAMRPGQA